MSLELRMAKKIWENALFAGRLCQIFPKNSMHNQPSCKNLGEITKEYIYLLEMLHKPCFKVNNEIFLHNHVYGMLNSPHIRGETCIHLHKGFSFEQKGRIILH